MKHWMLIFCLLPFVSMPSAVAGATPPPVQLAADYQDEDPRDYWVSEKLDGVRAYWDGDSLLTRSGRRIAVPAGFTRGWPDRPLDGELWAGRGRFERVMALIQRQTTEPSDWTGLRFMVFDLPAASGSFDERLGQLRELLATSTSKSIDLVEQFRVRSRDELRERLAKVIAAGGEGLMLHRSGASHRIGRSEQLLKLKPFADAEARVVAHLSGQGRYAGMMGSLLVETDAGVRFRIGSGFTDEQRRHPPAAGSVITFRYNGLTAHGTPRFARFLRLRPAE